MSLTLYSGTTSPNVVINLYQVEKDYAYIRFDNNTPNHLNVNLGGRTTDIGEFYSQDVLVPVGFQGTIVVTPSAVITSIGHGQANNLVIKGQYAQEVVSPVSQAIPQQAVTTTATGKPIFSATVGFGATVTVQQNLNIFNPANSGVVGTFHAGRVYTNDATGPTANIAIISGADQNLPNPVTAVSHTGTSNPPVSVMHCTSSDAALGTPGSVPETMNMQQNVTQDFIGFPDVIQLFPGNNLFIDLSSGAVGHVVRLTSKWTEDTIVPPVLVIGPNAVASSVVNDNNPTGTTVVEATAQGDSPSDVLIQNSGISQFKGLMTLLAGLKVTGTTSPGIDLSGVTGAIAITLKHGSLTGIEIHNSVAVAIAGTVINHSLGVIPTMVMGILDEGAAGASVFGWNRGTATSTQFTAFGSAAASFDIYIFS